MSSTTPAPTAAAKTYFADLRQHRASGGDRGVVEIRQRGLTDASGEERAGASLSTATAPADVEEWQSVKRDDSMKFNSTPNRLMYKHLTNEVRRGRLVALRETVTPILANNLLPYFTAHDVEHCDRVTSVIDAFIEPCQGTANRLTDDELFVVYAAAYLHDIGMQYENVGNSPTIKAVIGTKSWEALPVPMKRDLLRQHHPVISAELVRMSVRNQTPPIGFQLVDEDHPTAIASICEAHGSETTGQRYTQLTADAPGLRMRLLAGILRCADILEESRRRAVRARSESLNLPMASQVHWWRHYYTNDVRFDQADRSIELWFEFPPKRRTELSRIVPELQVPEVRAELTRHHEVFAPHNLSWFVRTCVYESPYQAVEEIPEPVLHEMLLEVTRRRQLEAADRRRALAAMYEEARPQLERRLEDVRRAKLPADSAATQLRNIALDMQQFGAPASARSLLREAFARAEEAGADLRIEIGLVLARQLVKAKQFDGAVRLYDRLRALVDRLPSADVRIDEFWNEKIDAEIRGGFFENGRESMQQRSAARGVTPEEDRCCIEELRYLEGTDTKSEDDCA